VQLQLEKRAKLAHVMIIDIIFISAVEKQTTAGSDKSNLLNHHFFSDRRASQPRFVSKQNNRERFDSNESQERQLADHLMFLIIAVPLPESGKTARQR